MNKMKTRVPVKNDRNNFEMMFEMKRSLSLKSKLSFRGIVRYSFRRLNDYLLENGGILCEHMSLKYVRGDDIPRKDRIRLIDGKRGEFRFVRIPGKLMCQFLSDPSIPLYVRHFRMAKEIAELISFKPYSDDEIKRMNENCIYFNKSLHYMVKKGGSISFNEIFDLLEILYDEKIYPYMYSSYDSCWGISIQEFLSVFRLCRRNKKKFSRIVSIMKDTILKEDNRSALSGMFVYKRGTHVGELFSCIRPHTRRQLYWYPQYVRGRILIVYYFGRYYGEESTSTNDTIKIGKLSVESRWKILQSKRDFQSPFIRKENGIYKVDWNIIRDILSNQELDLTECPRGYLWNTFFGRIPRNNDIRNGIQKELIIHEKFKRNFKFFLRYLKDNHENMDGAHDYNELAKSIILFGNLALQIPVNGEGLTLRSISRLSVHDNPDAARWIWNRRHSHDIGNIVKIYNNWDLIVKELGPNFDIKRALYYISALNYENVENIELAIEFARFSYSQETFEKTQRKLGKFLKKVEESNDEDKYKKLIPHLEISLNEYKMYNLSSYDMRHLTMGDYTNCCQHVGGAGESCCWHALRDPLGTTFVIEKNGVIVAQSWTWMSKHNDYIVFDNIETLSVSSYENQIAELYTMMAQKMLDELEDIREIRVGKGYSDLKLKKYWTKADDIVKTPKDVYSDADDVQYIIKKR